MQFTACQGREKLKADDKNKDDLAGGCWIKVAEGRINIDKKGLLLMIKCVNMYQWEAGREKPFYPS